MYFIVLLSVGCYVGNDNLERRLIFCVDIPIYPTHEFNIIVLVCLKGCRRVQQKEIEVKIVIPPNTAGETLICNLH